MKTNAQQINALAKLAEPKPFDAVQTAHFLAREIVGYNKSSDKIISLQNEIEATKAEKGTRKRAIDALLKDLWQNGVTMVEGKGVTKCPIRIALKEVLSKEGLADTTVNNIISAVSFAVNNKKPYDIKARDKYNAALKAEKEKEKLKNEILKGATTPTATTPTPTATTPTATATTPTATATATTPTATATTPTATATTPTTKINAPIVEPEKATQYCKSMSTLMSNVFNLTEPRRMLNDAHEKTYDDIIIYMNEIMDLVSSLK
jgi:hypothetical protein